MGHSTASGRASQAQQAASSPTVENSYKFNEEMSHWERVDRVQSYNGVKIETVTSHADYFGAPNTREYRLTWPDGYESWHAINKRPGGNIKDLKKFIDAKKKMGR